MVKPRQLGRIQCHLRHLRWTAPGGLHNLMRSAASAPAGLWCYGKHFWRRNGCEELEIDMRERLDRSDHLRGPGPEPKHKYNRTDVQNHRTHLGFRLVL